MVSQCCAPVWCGFGAVSVYCGGISWCSWLKHCATSWKVVGLIPNGVFGIFHWANFAAAQQPWVWLGPLTEMHNKGVSCGGNCGRYIGLTTLPLSCANCLEFWEPQPPGTLRACPCLYRDSCTCTFTCVMYQTAICYNPHNSSNWYSCITVQLGYKCIFCQNVVSIFV